MDILLMKFLFPVARGVSQTGSDEKNGFGIAESGFAMGP